MPENNGVGLTVLVVDDCVDIRLMLRTMLERRGYGVQEAENGRAAIMVAERDL